MASGKPITHVNLVPELDVLDNVQMRLLGAGWSPGDRIQRTHYLVEALASLIGLAIIQPSCRPASSSA